MLWQIDCSASGWPTCRYAMLQVRGALHGGLWPDILEPLRFFTLCVLTSVKPAASDFSLIQEVVNHSAGRSKCMKPGEVALARTRAELAFPWLAATP